jgi:hypothetical protein
VALRLPQSVLLLFGPQPVDVFDTLTVTFQSTGPVTLSLIACTEDEVADGCAGLDERHRDAPEECWRYWGRCDRCGVIGEGVA